MPKPRKDWRRTKITAKAGKDLLTHGIPIEYRGRAAFPSDLGKQTFWWNTSFKGKPGRFTPTKAEKGVPKGTIGRGILGITTGARNRYAREHATHERDMTPAYRGMVENNLDAIMHSAGIDPSTVTHIVVDPLVFEGGDAIGVDHGPYTQRRLDAIFEAFHYLSSTSSLFARDTKMMAFKDVVQGFSSKATFHLKGGMGFEADIYNEIAGQVGGFGAYKQEIKDGKLVRKNEPCAVIIGSEENPKTIHQVVNHAIHESIETQLGDFLCDHVNRKYKKVSYKSPQLTSYLYEHDEAGELLTQALTEHAMEDITSGKRKRNQGNPFTEFVREHDIHGTLLKYQEDPEQFVRIWKEWKGH